jgi:predicted amidohydrolase YtcJ
MKTNSTTTKRILHSLPLRLMVLTAGTSQAQQKADLIIYNGKVATMNQPGEFKQAIAMKDGIILATGTSAQLMVGYKSANTKLIDAGGKTVIPGLK